MKNGIYVETPARNLKEYNRMNKGRKSFGYEVEAVYIGYYMSANGYMQRTYQDYVVGTYTAVGEPYNIYFNEED